MADLQYVDPQQAEQLRCPMCTDVFTNPVLVCEGEHHLCRACLDGLRQSPTFKGRCPECRRRLRVGNGQRFLKNMLEQLRVYCPNRERGCEVMPARGDLQRHLDSCPEAIVQCEHCPVSMQRRYMLASHRHCDAARFGCDFVSDNEEAVAVHTAECAVYKCRRQFERYEQEIAELRMSAVPPGAMLAWTGWTSQLPPGWALCDGKAGLPDWSRLFQVGMRSAPLKRKRDGSPSLGPSEADVEYRKAYIARPHPAAQHAAAQPLPDAGEEEAWQDGYGVYGFDEVQEGGGGEYCEYESAGGGAWEEEEQPHEVEDDHDEEEDEDEDDEEEEDDEDRSESEYSSGEP